MSYIVYSHYFATLEACLMLVKFRVETTILFQETLLHSKSRSQPIQEYLQSSQVQYAWKHKVPKRHSAFTYWEEDIPPHNY